MKVKYNQVINTIKKYFNRENFLFKKIKTHFSGTLKVSILTVDLILLYVSTLCFLDSGRVQLL